jgi:DNA-binding PadR family transcriptional regulator
MWKLWRHRLIKPKQFGDKVLEKMKTRGHGDVKNHFKITDAGKEYLRLIEETDSTGEARVIL